MIKQIDITNEEININFILNIIVEIIINYNC
jgi:hypothetical protein